MHLLYARYFIKVLNDLGLVGFREPFPRLFNHGWVDMGGAKMSKSKGNVVSPDELIAMDGADALRLHILFIGPADARVDWQTDGLEGMSRFLRRLWRVDARGRRAARDEPAGDARAQGARDDRRRSPTTSAAASRTTRRSPR